MKAAIASIVFFCALAFLLWDSAPRVMSDVWHARDFVPAEGHRITSYKCTNWNLVMFNDCTVTFVSPQDQKSRQFTDYRFGPAPRDPIRLLQRRDNPSAVTTNVSLQTLWNRAFLVLTMVLGGLVLAMTRIARVLKSAEAPPDAPIAAPSGAPIRAPIGVSTFQSTDRSTFGRRGA